MKNSIKKFGAAAVACLVVAGVAFASVTFDPDTGTGFVGKGDVQTAFGLNNPQIQAILNADPQAFTFSYNATDEYSAVCTWTTGPDHNQKVHNVSHTTNTEVVGALNGLPRPGPSQFTGFNLTGFGTPSDSGAVPVVGDPCPSNEGHGGTWSSVELTSSSGGLYVTYNGVSVLLQ